MATSPSPTELSEIDQQVQDATPLDEVTEAILRPDATLTDIVATIMDAYADRPAVGERARELTTDPATGRRSLTLLPTYGTVTYRELWARAAAVAAEWHHDDLTPVRAGDAVTIIGFTSTDYLTLELALLRLGAVAVPLQSGATIATLTPIVAETEPRVLASSVEMLDTAVELVLGSPSPRRLVVFDYHPDVDDQREKVEAARRRLADAGSSAALDSLLAVRERGQDLPDVEPVTIDDDTLSLLVYTSGSTGTPKGAMYPGRNLRSLWQGWFHDDVHRPSISLNYMPMSHVAGRAVLFGTLGRGGTNYFVANGDLSTLFEDLELSRPTELFLVPRVCDMLFQHYQTELPGRDAEDVRTELREKLLGGRLLWIACGSAPLSPEMSAFVESCVLRPVHDGYGSTELGSVLFDNKILRPPVLEYKLVDVPELGYFRTDAPYPRGELLVRSATVTPGYYKRPEVTAATFDEDGFYRTGDIMAEVGPDELRYVDRRSNVLKLSQGEFVAVSRLEAEYVNSPLVRQIFVYGSSERAYLLAVVVPTEETVARGGDVKARVLESLRRIAKEVGLNSYEIPRDFLLETVPFSTANGLLSEVRKLLRPKLKARYGEQLDQLYVDLAERETAELRQLRVAGKDQPVFETVVRAAQAVLGGSSGQLRADAHFTDLGGDSLSALTFSNLLKEIFEIDVPVGVVISPANNLGQLVEYIEKALRSGSGRPTFATVHGADSTVARADDLTLDKFIDAATLAGVKTLPRPSGPVRTVLLTGANGYLGRFLALEWLELVARNGGKVICIVRGGTVEAARRRLDEVFDSGDAELPRHYQKLAAEHLEVLAGDIGEPNLGLDEQTWRRLADTVDLIVHPAALVNHVLPYDQLFGPNVVGTAELIKMAITSRIKPFTYLSTVAVVAGQTESAEDDDIRVSSPARPLDDSYANGYAISKWAGEVLLREAYDLCGLPVATFRSDLILAHSRYSGQLNVPDMFTRLLLSVIATGIAPKSFYRNEGARPAAHYDGLPSDFTAEAITTLGSRATDGYRSYNVLNPHADGISLDVFVDWLVEAGYPISRLDDYDEWFARFETVIRALPERQRQHSMLPLLHSFAQPAEPVDGLDIPTERFRAAVCAAEIGADKDIPHVTAELIRKYASDLRRLDLI
jgi:fatty acid CoA ligase FadD9